MPYCIVLLAIHNTFATTYTFVLLFHAMPPKRKQRSSSNSGDKRSKPQQAAPALLTQPPPSVPLPVNNQADLHTSALVADSVGDTVDVNHVTPPPTNTNSAAPSHTSTSSMPASSIEDKLYTMLTMYHNTIHQYIYIGKVVYGWCPSVCIIGHR